jgi:hypothetical protein
MQSSIGIARKSASEQARLSDLSKEKPRRSEASS